MNIQIDKNQSQMIQEGLIMLCSQYKMTGTDFWAEAQEILDKIHEAEKQDGKEMTEEPIKDSIISISQLKHALVCIDEAINACEAQHNSGIDAGATEKLRHVYDWLECTIGVLEAL